MKARDKALVAVFRMINAELKRVEVDERRELADADVLTILTRMLKQRQDSLNQFVEAQREDLAEQERFEMEVVKRFMPEALDDEELTAAVAEAITEAGAQGMQDMGRVMGLLKTRVQGRADMGALSARVKAALSG
jgi:uncharacterized protein YqeY